MGRWVTATLAAALIATTASAASAGCARYLIDSQELTIDPPTDCLDVTAHGADFCATPTVEFISNCGDAAFTFIEGRELFYDGQDTFTVASQSSTSFTMLDPASSSHAITLQATQDGVTHTITLRFNARSDYGSCAITRLPAQTPWGGAGVAATLLGAALLRRRRRRSA